MKRWLARAWMAGLAAAMVVAGWGCAPKEGALAGPRVLEHMVDAVLYFEGVK